MRASAFDPPQVPPGFWGRDEVRQALLAKDMGRLFRLLGKHAGLSQTRIGTATGLGQGRVSEVIKGTRRVSAVHVFHRIAEGFAMPDDARRDLGISPAASTSARLPGRLAADGAGDLAAQLAAARGIDRAVIRLLQGETDAIRLLDRQIGAPPIAGKLESHLAHVEAGLRHSLRPGVRQLLAAVLADACALAGWQAIDMGRLARAWDHFDRAMAAAREAADPSLLAHAAAERAYVLLDLGRPADARDVVRAAAEETGPAVPPRMRAWLHAAEAEMSAAAGDGKACWHALDQASRVLPSDPSDPGLPYLSLDDGHMARWRGNCLVTVGDPRAADGLDTALTAIDDTFTRARAGMHCDLAAARHVAGEREEARRHLRHARELADETGSARIRRRVRGLAARIGDPDPGGRRA
jgi:tetratricopeptide (TPR) repeat protein